MIHMDINYILKRINNLNTKDLKTSQFYKCDIEINYKDIIDIWKNFIEKKYLTIDDNNNLDLNNDKYKSIFKITVFENILSFLLESVFDKQLKELKENLILVYIKNQEKFLILFKSFYPLLNDNINIKLPYWDFLIDTKDICDNLKILFKDDENICVMTYVLNNKY